MTARTIARTVTFTRSFVLAGLDEAQPAGTYLVETNEEILNTMLSPAYRRISTVIHLRAKPGITQIAVIDPNELDAALARDSEAAE